MTTLLSMMREVEKGDVSDKMLDGKNFSILNANSGERREERGRGDP